MKLRRILHMIRDGLWSSPLRRAISIVTAIVAVTAVILSDDGLLIGGTIFASGMSITLLVYAARYGVKSNWRANPIGRAQMYAMLSFGLFGAQVSIGNWTTLIIHSEGYAGRLEIRYLLNYAILVMAINMLRALVRIQRERRNSPDLGTSTPPVSQVDELEQ